MWASRLLANFKRAANFCFSRFSGSFVYLLTGWTSGPASVCQSDDRWRRSASCFNFNTNSAHKIKTCFSRPGPATTWKNNTRPWRPDSGRWSAAVRWTTIYRELNATSTGYARGKIKSDQVFAGGFLVFCSRRKRQLSARELSCCFRQQLVVAERRCGIFRESRQLLIACRTSSSSSLIRKIIAYGRLSD